jgi:hypothetical protein
MSIMALASKVDELITLPADQKTAKLIAVFGTDELEITSDDLAQVAEHGDVYDLLESDIARSTAQFADAITLVTCGWASPIAEGQSDDEQVAPSQHPERRRVRLVVTATREHTASVLRFSDDWDNPITDEGHARGSLADAVRELFQD